MSRRQSVLPAPDRINEVIASFLYVITEEIVGAKPSEVVPDVMAVEIEKVIRDRARRVVYKTTDGRYFRRSSSSRVTFREGDNCAIDKGMFGSMFLVRDDGQKNKVEELSVK